MKDQECPLKADHRS